MHTDKAPGSDGIDMTAYQETLPIGVVVEKRRIDHPWQPFRWLPTAVFAGASPRDPRGEWVVLRQGEDFIQYHAGTLSLELFRKETEAYKVNLSQTPPRIFVVLRQGEDVDAAHPVMPSFLTASPYEAQDFLDSGDEIVEGVEMPPDVMAFVQDFVDRHHVDEPFYKRKRKRASSGDEAFSRKPPVERGGDHGRS
jgi:hypothetical protein